ncbi:MAG: hypothetical protein M0006_02315 [Magnetospirillum sp.]|nr:hypothetical protein [Magnetospirillum sp.]
MAIDWDTAVIGPCMDVFGEPVTYAPAAGGMFVVTGVFDEAYREIDSITADGVPLTGEMPVLGVQLSQFAQPPVQVDQLTVQRTGITYVVKEVRLDGHGGAKLMLGYLSG